jgi:hypothetical protein
MAICTEFKAMAETNRGTVLSETKRFVKLRSGALRKMPTARAEVVGDAGELRRKLDATRRETDELKLICFWTNL